MYINTVSACAKDALIPTGFSGQKKALITLSDFSKRNYYQTFFKQAELNTGQVFTENEKRIFLDHSKILRLRKRQFFLQENDCCRYIGFIIKGAAKTYSVNERGTESILSFSIENEWITNFQSFWESNVSEYHIEALENLEMIAINREQLFALIAEIPVMTELLRRFQWKQLSESQRRINAALSMNAEERYFDLLVTKPHYAQRFSQSMLACYLGVKPETLSRIRKY